MPYFRGAHHAGCPPAPRHLLPLQPLHERGHPAEREPHGEAELPQERGGALPGAQRRQAEEGSQRAWPGEEHHPESGRVGQAQGRHVRGSPLQVQAVVAGLAAV